MNLFIRFFLSLCLLLWSGDSYLYAFTEKNQLTVTTTPSKSQYGTVTNRQILVINGTISGSNRDHDKIEMSEETVEEDNDESATFKKQLEILDYFGGFCIRTSGYFSRYPKHIAFSRHLSYSSSDRYIMFCVIRV